MRAKVSRNYSVEFTDEEIVDGLCYLLSHFRSTTEAVQVASLIRNADSGIKVVHTETGVSLQFTYDDEDENEE